MGLDHKFITKVLSDGLPTVAAAGLDPNMFPPELEKVFTYISDFVRQHNKMPDPTTVQSEFGIEWIEDAPEPFAYYADAVRERYLSDYLGNEISEAAGLLGTGDHDAYITKLQHALDNARETLSLATPPMDLVRSGHNRYLSYVSRRQAGLLAGLPLPWPTINHVNPGIRPGEFWIFVGRLKMGKTFILTKLASWFYLLGLKVLFVSMEMDTDSIGYRFDAIHYGLPYADILKLTLTQAQEAYYKAQTEQYKDVDSRLRIIGVDKVISVSHIESQMKDFQPDIVLVDAIYKLQPEFRTSKTARWESVALMAHEIQRLGLVTKIPIIGSTQFNKQQKKDDKVISENIGLSWELPQNVNAALGINCSDEERIQHRMRIAVMDGRDFSQLPTIVINWDMTTMDFSEIGTFYQGSFVAHPTPLVYMPNQVRNQIIPRASVPSVSKPLQQSSLLPQTASAPSSPTQTTQTTSQPTSSQPGQAVAPTQPTVNLPGPSNSPPSGGTP